MNISLIGMSGTGKSRWSKKLSDAGFIRFCCDDLIADNLTPDLIDTDGARVPMGEWMGFPFDPGYKKRALRYLDRERTVLSRIFDTLENEPGRAVKDTVIDTTGSVIYTGEDLLGRLRRCSAVVHLATPPEVRDVMLEAYLKNMRPVLWMDLFSKTTGESNKGALARCYPKLLSQREALYRQLADVTIDYNERHQEDFGIDRLLNYVQSIHRQQQGKRTNG